MKLPDDVTEAFLDDIRAVYEKHGLVLMPEDAFTGLHVAPADVTDPSDPLATGWNFLKQDRGDK